MNRIRNLSGTSRNIFIVVIIVLILVAVYAFFTSETGRTITLVCCGAGILLAVVGILSERGMRR